MMPGRDCFGSSKRRVEYEARLHFECCDLEVPARGILLSMLNLYVRVYVGM